MTQESMWKATFIVFVGSLGALAGCGSSAPVSVCPPENEIRGVCVGVPQTAVCEVDSCTVGVPCMAGITEVSDNASLTTAAAQAMPGACIALAPGTYADVELPAGVSLLGKSAAAVTVGQVTVGAGQGAVVRGLTASAIRVNGATGAKIESVRVLDSTDTGVLVAAQSSVALLTSTIEGSALYGVYAVDSLDLSLDRIIITGSGAPGLWVASTEDCPAAAAQPMLEVTSTIVRDNHIAGVALFGAKAMIRGVDILATAPGGEMLQTGKFGGGLTIASCADIDAKGLRVHDSTSYGVLVEASTGTIGGDGPDEEVEIHRNVIGLSVQKVNGPFMLHTAQLDQNKGVGISLSGDSHGIVFCRSGVSRTEKKFLPTLDADVKEVGHGLLWAEKSDATVMEMTLSDNALASVLIDGAASGVLKDVTLSGSDVNLGIVQQSYTGGAQPMFTGTTPPPQVIAGQMFPVAARPAVLPKSL